MFVHFQGIVLNTIRYSDRQNIVRVLTDEMGLVSFAVAQGPGRGARALAAALMPLSVIEAVANVRPGRELASMRDVRRSLDTGNIYANPVKTAVAMYVTELLWHTIVGQQRDRALFEYVLSAIEVLNGIRRGAANFHLCFTFGLAARLGIRPDMATYSDGSWFDMEGGVFSRYPTERGQWLPPERARVIVLLSRMTMRNLHLFRFTREQRNEVLTTMLNYFRMHHPAVGTMRSVEVLRQVFD